MSNYINTLLKYFILLLFMYLFSYCTTKKEELFASNAAIKTNILNHSFPNDLVYEKIPLSSVFLGMKRIEPGIFQLNAFDSQTGKKVWQLPFTGEYVGETTDHVLVYESKKDKLHFINTKTGESNKTIDPAPFPLSSKSGFAAGMAFTEELYITTKPLYGQIIKNGIIDTSWRIGFTAKKWKDDKQIWFVSPKKQIVVSEYKPIIRGNKVLLIHPLESIDGGQTIQIVDLNTGIEITELHTLGEFMLLGNCRIIEKRSSNIRCFDPFSGENLWQVPIEISNTKLYTVNNQISLISANNDNTRAVIQLNAETGKVLKSFQIPDIGSTVLSGIFLPDDQQIWLNFSKNKYQITEERPYDYWVSIDPKSQKPIWRTDFESHGLSSLINCSPL